MAFDNNKEKISSLLKQTELSKERVVENTWKDFERTKQYQFTLQPSVREKIDRLAKEKGYRSASSFINAYFKNL